jgi:hypothetical protein
MPILIRWETELLVIQATELPQLEKLLVNANQLADSADRFSRTAERLPELISTERQQLSSAEKSTAGPYRNCRASGASAGCGQSYVRCFHRHAKILSGCAAAT